MAPNKPPEYVIPHHSQMNTPVSLYSEILCHKASKNAALSANIPPARATVIINLSIFSSDAPAFLNNLIDKKVKHSTPIDIIIPNIGNSNPNILISGNI